MEDRQLPVPQTATTIGRPKSWRFGLRRLLYPPTVLAIVVVGVVAARFGAWWWTQKAWFELQAQQMATIKRLGEFLPAGQSREVWENALVTPYNVWGNVTYHPSYSNISNQEMRSLLTDLEAILATTTPDNSIDSVDRVFQLLLRRGQKTEFISGYRDEFRAYFESTRHEQLKKLPNEMNSKRDELEGIFDQWLPDAGGRVLLKQLDDFCHAA